MIQTETRSTPGAPSPEDAFVLRAEGVSKSLRAALWIAALGVVTVIVFRRVADPKRA